MRTFIYLDQNVTGTHFLPAHLLPSRSFQQCCTQTRQPTPRVQQDFCPTHQRHAADGQLPHFPRVGRRAASEGLGQGGFCPRHSLAQPRSFPQDAPTRQEAEDFILYYCIFFSLLRGFFWGVCVWKIKLNKNKERQKERESIFCSGYKYNYKITFSSMVTYFPFSPIMNFSNHQSRKLYDPFFLFHKKLYKAFPVQPINIYVVFFLIMGAHLAISAYSTIFSNHSTISRYY